MMCGLLLLTGFGVAEPQANSPGDTPPHTAPEPAALQQAFFSVIREGDTAKFLSYVPEQGTSVGRQARHVTRTEIEQQFAQHRDLYCKLFDSSCIPSPGNLDSGKRVCSYRELLTHSDKVRTAATEAVRGGVRQAILVAEVKNDQCAGLGLIDFIFNEGHSGWELFSMP